MELPSVTGARDVTVEGGVLAAGTGRVARLAHRWTFNSGDLTDRAGGGKDAWIVNPTDASKTIGTNATCITLPGGTKGTAGHIELGSNILPNDGSPITVELWATTHGLGNWTRVFEIGNNWTSTFMMSWNRQGNINLNRLEAADGVEPNDTTKYHPAFQTDDTLAPFTVNTEYHIAVTMEPDAESGRWKVTGYKQDAATVETLKKVTVLADEGWSPAKLNQRVGLLGYSLANAPDSHASYNEVRVWSIALTEEQLTQHAQLGPDMVPYYPLSGVAMASSLPATARLDVRAGACLDLCGGTNTSASLTGEGTVMNGAFAATEAIRPGTGGASGTLKLADGVTLSGPLVIAPGDDGTCGALEAEGALDLSGLDLAVADGHALKAGVTYTVATCTPGQPIVPFRSVPGVCAGIIYDSAAGRVTCKIGGLSIFIR